MAKNAFNSVKLKKPNGSVFDLSHNVKQSLKFGTLYPTMTMDCVPGDRIRLGCSALVRMMPMLAPLMHRVDVYMHYFFVPYRLLWSNWENFITNTEVAGNVPAHPYFNLSAGNMNTVLHQYFGVPTPSLAGNDGTEKVSAFPWAAYQFIYNEYYRDQNLINEVTWALADGENSYSSFRDFRIRAWQHDYFTSALPFAQKGDAVTIPLGSQKVVLDPDWSAAGADPHFDDETGTPETGAVTQQAGVPPFFIQVGATTQRNAYNPDGSLITEDLGEATTINDLRRAYALQRWLERNAVGGTRYIEHILAHWGVRSSDKRLQRPEYITGSKAPVQISEVLNTTGTTELPQGNMAGHGVSVTKGRYGSYYCEEHGLIMGIMSVMPKPAYMQGIPKHLLQTNNAWDYFTPEFEHIGEQEILKKELYGFNGTEGAETFGYTPRYAQYKYMPNRVAGDMMSTLKFWHLAMDFADTPLLNQEFIECTPRTDIFAAGGSADYLISDIHHDIKASRLMSFYSTPI